VLHALDHGLLYMVYAEEPDVWAVHPHVDFVVAPVAAVGYRHPPQV
jgi:hypothetical protein